MKIRIRLTTALLLIMCLVSISGCSTWQRLNKTEQGATIGGVTGAGLGAIVGSQVGAPGAGIAIGGAAGALTGGLIGHEFDQVYGRQASLEERQRRQAAAIHAQRKEIDELKKNSVD